MKQFLTGDESQDRVSQELKLLVIPHPAALECCLKLPRLGSMSKGLLQQLRSNEAVAQHGLQRGNFL